MADIARRCREPECGRGGKLVRGMCAKHYRYWLDHTPPAERETAPRFVDDFWDHVRKSHEHGCWVWTGATADSRKGYGSWRSTLAHRESWRRAMGEIPAGLWVLHHCDNPPCVNPAHLYLGTVVENVRDMVDRGRNYVPPLKTHCPQGHELTGENVRIYGRNAARGCRTCGNERSARRQQALRRARGVAPANRVSHEERQQMASLWESGVPQRAIAARFGRALTTVQRALRESRIANA